MCPNPLHTESHDNTNPPLVHGRGKQNPVECDIHLSIMPGVVSLHWAVGIFVKEGPFLESESREAFLLSFFLVLLGLAVKVFPIASGSVNQESKFFFLPWWVAKAVVEA